MYLDNLLHATGSVWRCAASLRYFLPMVKIWGGGVFAKILFTIFISTIMNFVNTQLFNIIGTFYFASCQNMLSTLVFTNVGCLSCQMFLYCHCWYYSLFETLLCKLGGYASTGSLLPLCGRPALLHYRIHTKLIQSICYSRTLYITYKLKLVFTWSCENKMKMKVLVFDTRSAQRGAYFLCASRSAYFLSFFAPRKPFLCTSQTILD